MVEQQVSLGWAFILLGLIAMAGCTVDPERRTHRIGPFLVAPGAHELQFQSHEPPTVADVLIHNRDKRPLSVAIGTWRWQVEGAQP